jgi:UDP-2,3-diacylglucosamine hydrolase
LAHYFASDVHLRADQPDRDCRFGAWVNQLTASDALIIVGDLCDFWMGARQTAGELAQYPSLRALAEFRRRGGFLAIMAGNHDTWLCPFYAGEVGAEILVEPHDMMVHGLRVRLVHGHLLGARKPWKAWMESYAFFRLFGLVPGPIARGLDWVLARNNERGLLGDEERHLQVYRAYGVACRDLADLVVIGHVHRPVDEADRSPRLIVLGGWQYHTSYLRIDERGVSFRVDHDHVDHPAPAASSCRSH